MLANNSSPFLRKKVFAHTGHIGDIIAFIPIYRALNGDFLLVIDDHGMCPMSGYKYNSLKPLLDNQGIPNSMVCNGISIDYDMSGWRECYKHEISLMDSQARYVNLVSRENGTMNITKPWLKVDADPLTKGRVIFNRSPRYRNEKFPWKDVLNFFGERSLFIGAEHEYDDFCKIVGNVEYYKTPSCLEVAKAIEGADFFVGNQSSSYWIAAGLRKPLLQETSPICPNSIIPYKGATYSTDGIINFDKLEK
jgi:hypothetical protein